MSKLLWMAFLFLTGLAGIWQGTSAGIDLWKYWQLTHEVPARVKQIEMIPKGTNYGLEVKYSYEYQGRPFSGSILLNKPYYLNRKAALDAKKIFEEMQWTTWVDPRHPKVSSLQKNFPIKKTVYAIIVIGIFTYFGFLYWYLQLSARE